MAQALTDILMITYNRPDYTRLALTRLLETCDAAMRVWVWHNGEDAETLAVVRELAGHPRVHEFHHSKENVRLREPTNWFWQRAEGEYLGKVDDDCLMPDGWADTLRRAHADAPKLGAVCCWPFMQEDFVPELAERKITALPGGHRVLRNCWINGSGYLMKRACREETGLLGAEESFSQYCIRGAVRGWVHGWYYPFLMQDHMDDPRSPHTQFKTEEDFQRRRSLSAQRFGIDSLEELRRRAHLAAVEVQQADPDPRQHVGWRRKVRRLKARLMGQGPNRTARFSP